jgi:hypothetical protein
MRPLNDKSEDSAVSHIYIELVPTATATEVAMQASVQPMRR